MTPAEEFHQLINDTLETIADFCAERGRPEFGDHMTLLLRYPGDPDRSLIATNDTLDEVIAVLQYLQDEGVREGDEDEP